MLKTLLWIAGVTFAAVSFPKAAGRYHKSRNGLDLLELLALVLLIVGGVLLMFSTFFG